MDSDPIRSLLEVVYSVEENQEFCSPRQRFASANMHMWMGCHSKRIAFDLENPWKRDAVWSGQYTSLP